MGEHDRRRGYVPADLDTEELDAYLRRVLGEEEAPVFPEGTRVGDLLDAARERDPGPSTEEVLRRARERPRAPGDLVNPWAEPPAPAPPPPEAAPPAARRRGTAPTTTSIRVPPTVDERGAVRMSEDITIPPEVVRRGDAAVAEYVRGAVAEREASRAAEDARRAEAAAMADITAAPAPPEGDTLDDMLRAARGEPTVATSETVTGPITARASGVTTSPMTPEEVAAARAAIAASRATVADDGIVSTPVAPREGYTPEAAAAIEADRVRRTREESDRTATGAMAEADAAERASAEREGYYVGVGADLARARAGAEPTRWSEMTPEEEAAAFAAAEGVVAGEDGPRALPEALAGNARAVEDLRERIALAESMPDTAGTSLWDDILADLGSVYDELTGAPRGATSEPGAPPPPGPAPAPGLPVAAPAPEPRRTRRRVPAARTASAAPAMTEGELLVEALTNAPEGADLFPENEETALDRALGRASQAGDIAARRAWNEATGYADANDAIRGAERARAENEALRREAMGRGRDRYRAAMERASAMTLDPEGWYHDRGVLGSISAAIAVGLGHLGAGLSGSGTNEALGIINASIERDLEAQRTAIEQAHSRAAGEANLLDLLDAEFTSRDAAVAAARAAMLEDVANRVAQEGARLDSEEARMQAMALRDEIAAEAAASAQASLEAEQDREIDLALREAQAREAMANAARAERRAMGGGGGPSYTRPTSAMMDAMNRAALTTGRPMAEIAEMFGVDPRLVVGPPGAPGVIAASTSGERAGVISELNTALDRLEFLVPEDTEEDIPGIGPIYSRVPDAVLEAGIATGAVPPEAMEVRSRVGVVRDLLSRLRTGAVINESEEAFYLRQMEGARTERQLREAIAAIRADIGGWVFRTPTGTSVHAEDDAMVSEEGGVPLEEP